MVIMTRQIIILSEKKDGGLLWYNMGNGSATNTQVKFEDENRVQNDVCYISHHCIIWNRSYFYVFYNSWKRL